MPNQTKQNQTKQNQAKINKGKPSIKEEVISLVEGAKYSGYSSDYLRLRIRQNKLKAKKLGRDWVTTKGWLDDYLQEHSKKNITPRVILNDHASHSEASWRAEESLQRDPSLSFRVTAGRVILNQQPDMSRGAKNLFSFSRVKKARAFKAGTQGLFLLGGLLALTCLLLAFSFSGLKESFLEGVFIRGAKLEQAKAADFIDLGSPLRGDNSKVLSVKKSETGKITQDDLRSALALVGVDLTLLDDGMIKIIEIKEAKITEFEMTDKTTGDIWCFLLKGSEFVKKEGSCPKQDSTSLPNPAPEPAAELNLRKLAPVLGGEKFALKEKFKALAPLSEVLEKPPKPHA